MAPAVATYAPRDPCRTVLYHVIAEHLETFLASCHDNPEATGLRAYTYCMFDVISLLASSCGYSRGQIEQRVAQ
jgi:hypothetical protein